MFEWNSWLYEGLFGVVVVMELLVVVVLCGSDIYFPIELLLVTLWDK